MCGIHSCARSIIVPLPCPQTKHIDSEYQLVVVEYSREMDNDAWCKKYQVVFLDNAHEEKMPVKMRMTAIRVSRKDVIKRIFTSGHFHGAVSQVLCSGNIQVVEENKSNWKTTHERLRCDAPLCPCAQRSRSQPRIEKLQNDRNN